MSASKQDSKSLNLKDKFGPVGMILKHPWDNKIERPLIAIIIEGRQPERIPDNGVESHEAKILNLNCGRRWRFVFF